MTPFRILLAEGSAVVGMGFGVWLIHSAFAPTSDVPNVRLLLLGTLDIVLCFLLLGYFLRLGLRSGEPLPRRWIAGGVAILAGFLGWLAALFVDCERQLVEIQQHRDYAQQLAKLDDSLRHMGEVMATAGVLDRHAWDVNHDQYVRLHDQLHAALKTRPAWDKDLTRIDEQVRLMRKAYAALPVENVAQQRTKLIGDFQLARDRAIQQVETCRAEIAQSERDATLRRDARWHSVGAAALTCIVGVLGCFVLALIFDRELRRMWKAKERLTEGDARYRAWIENDAEPIAVLDTNGTVVYANGAWQTEFQLDPYALEGTPLLQLIHADDRPRVSSAGQGAILCRLRGDYGIWHDVELHLGSRAEDGAKVVRCRVAQKPAESRAA